MGNMTALYFRCASLYHLSRQKPNHLEVNELTVFVRKSRMFLIEYCKVVAQIHWMAFRLSQQSVSQAWLGSCSRWAKKGVFYFDIFESLSIPKSIFCIEFKRAEGVKHIFQISYSFIQEFFEIWSINFKHYILYARYRTWDLRVEICRFCLMQRSREKRYNAINP